ncbi:MAG: DUF1697 domain-containing protein [Bacteroidia bacterium]
MALFLSILRGINVSGQKQIKMADLKKLYEELGFTNVRTFIQSGNVVFESKSITKLSEKIEKKIKEHYSFEVPVIIRTKEELQKAIDDNPFLKKKNIALDKLHITFLAEQPEEENIKATEAYDYTPDEFYISNKEVYVYCPNGYGNTKINNTFFEKKLKVGATTRNWKTSNELLKMMK